MADPVDMNSLDYWYPRLKGTGVRTPRTEVVKTEVDFLLGLDGQPMPGLREFVVSLQVATAHFGYPCFLRTGHGSGKHQWANTCLVLSEADMLQHVMALAEWSAIADFRGLPTTVWAIRELLPTEPAFCAWKQLPICRERRYFICGGEVVAHIPYWPEDAVEKSRGLPAGWRDALARLNEETASEIQYLTKQSEGVARSFKGAWSLDWLWTHRGWYAIDMALAPMSWGCPESLQESQANGQETPE